MDRGRIAMDQEVETDERKQSGSSASATKKIRQALTELAIYRQAKVSEDTFRAFCVRLAKESLDDVLGAIHTIQDLPRQSGELSFPEIGVFLTVTSALGVARRNRTSIESRKTTLVRFQCPECLYTCSGFTMPDDHRERRCMGFPRDKKTIDDTICGALMLEIFREDNFKTGNKAVGAEAR